jgi:hypothetical protein
MPCYRELENQARLAGRCATKQESSVAWPHMFEKQRGAPVTISHKITPYENMSALDVHGTPMICSGLDCTPRQV